MDLSRVKNRMLATVFTACQSLAARWAKRLEQDLDRIPWAEPITPLHLATLALVTTGGVHRCEDAPFDMKDPDGDPSFREVPVNTGREQLEITHDYYDHAHAREDINLVFPVDRLRALDTHDAVGRVHPVAYSFMGHIDGRHLKTLRQKSARAVASRLRDAGVDYALLVPA